MGRLRTIFFDVGNTLLFPNRERMLAPLHERRIFPSTEQMRSIERQTKLEFDKIEQDGSIDHGFWHIFYSRLLSEFDLRDPALLTALVNTVRISANWCDIRPGTREILDH